MSAPHEQGALGPESKPCGGCGAKSAAERCIGCLHDFGDEASAWLRADGAGVGPGWTTPHDSPVSPRTEAAARRIAARRAGGAYSDAPAVSEAAWRSEIHSAEAALFAASAPASGAERMTAGEVKPFGNREADALMQIIRAIDDLAEPWLEGAQEASGTGEKDYERRDMLVHSALTGAGNALIGLLRDHGPEGYFPRTERLIPDPKLLTAARDHIRGLERKLAAATPAPATPPGVPDSVRALLVEALAQHFHDEEHQHEGYAWVWPEYADDDGRRGNSGYVSITPPVVQMECREAAERITRRFEQFLATHPAGQSAGSGAETDALVDRFAVALKAKLRAAEAKYGWQNGWLKDDWQVECRHGLLRHVGKGDPLDVAAYAAFCWHHGWPTASQHSTEFVTGAVRATAEAIAAYAARYPDGSLLETSDDAIVRWNRVAAAVLASAPAATPGVPDGLRALSEAATQGEWYVESEKCDGSYGSGDEGREGYLAYSILTDAERPHGNPGVIAETSNSTLGVIHEEWNEDDFTAWDETARANTAFIVAAVNYVRTLLATHPAGQSAGSGVEAFSGKFWLHLREPRCVPERKGPFRSRDLAKTLREFMAAQPQAYISVVTVSHDGPAFEDGPQALQVTDGRSMSTGSKHIERVRAAHGDHSDLSAPDSTRTGVEGTETDEFDRRVQAALAAHQQVTAERDEAREVVALCNNSFGSYSYHLNPHPAEQIEKVKWQARSEWQRAEAAEASLATANAELARLRAEGEAKDRALKEIESRSRRWIRRDRISPNDVVVRDDGQHFKVLGLNGIGRIARAARAATAREG